MESVDYDTKPKLPVQRGARACAVCRAAKMKCVTSEGESRCQRCVRANAECVFEKHRRGRKPGSKLSEASKMLRKLEKGLNSAKSKAPAAINTSTNHDNGDPHYNYVRPGDQPPFSSTSSHFPALDTQPLTSPTYPSSAHPSSGPQSMEYDEEDDTDRQDGPFFPARMIRRESQRNEFFRTVLNTNENAAQAVNGTGHQVQEVQTGLSKMTSSMFGGPERDAISAGILNEEDAKVLFDVFYLRLNPFINLFDPSLHTWAYVRSKNAFLFTAILMASSKFFRTELFKPCHRLANELAIRAFADGARSVEVVQAFAVMTYWKDPEDTRTWAWIGYACRMAVDLGLNHYHAVPPGETPLQHLERRNRERTYLVLFIHDRSLATQTGKNWMLLDDECIQRSATWHEGTTTPRPEDVIVTAFVQLRRITAESTDIFHSYRSGSDLEVNNYEVILRNCNSKISTWTDTWEREMKRAGAESFHFSFITIFKSYCKLFLNSFGIHSALTATTGKETPSLTAMSACCMSAMDCLRIVSKDLPSLSMLRYGQDTITIMSAYAAVFLLRLLRNPVTLPLLNNSTPTEIKSLIMKTADAYHEAALLSPPSSVPLSNAAYHSRFLRLLLENEVLESRQNRPSHEQSHSANKEPPMHGEDRAAGSNSYSSPTTSPASSHGNSPVYAAAAGQQPYYSNSPPHAAISQPQRQDYHAGHGSGSVQPRAPTVMGPPGYSQGAIPTAPPQASPPDIVYWKNTFIELGFGNHDYHNHPHYPPAGGHPQYENSQQQQAYHNQSHHNQSPNGIPHPQQHQTVGYQPQQNMGQVQQYLRQ
ncbi:fungal-specific transcription factor domain-containing protein [Flagelloscypha sp. PMI_526]|nr:fungal-specific transcription factor domain-containing protein [Flagelloscypha sp. PMI_526]